MSTVTQTSRVLDLLRDLQVFSVGALAASAPQRDRRTRRQRRQGAPAAIDVTVPGALTVVPYLIEYAQSGMITVGDWVVKPARLQPEVLDTGLKWRVILNGGNGVGGVIDLEVDYISDDVRRLCQGEWVSVGGLSVRLPDARFVPEVYESAEGVAECVWHGGPRFRIDRFLLRSIEVELQEITVRPTDGDVSLSWLPGWAEPHLVWGE